jgi:hypothetical protein
MFTLRKPKTKLELEIDRLVLELKKHEPLSDDYSTTLNQLKELSKVQKEQSPARVSPDTAVIATANLAGILMIIKHESVNVIASKALGFIPKLR